MQIPITSNTGQTVTENVTNGLQDYINAWRTKDTEAQKPVSTCPNCGHCPSCGRSNWPAQPYWAQPVPYWHGPIWRWEGSGWSIPMSGNTGTIAYHVPK